MKINNIERKFIIILVLVIVIQTVTMICLGMQKKYFHIDEIYTYIISNSYDGDRLSNIPSLWNRWVAPEELSAAITVQNNEQFKYGNVYNNTALDCHPPLYYWAVHTVCSLFPNTFSVWFALSVNIVAMIFTDIILFLLGRRLLKSDFFALLTVTFWGISSTCFSTTIFLRMYSFSTLLSVAFLYLTVLMLQNGQKVKYLAASYLIALLGLFNHYYFGIYLFFVVFGYCVFKLFSKKYKEMFAYGFLMIFSVLSLVILFPAAITQATGSSTNNIGNEVSRNFLNFSTLLNSTLNNIKEFLNQYFTKISFILTAALLLVLCVFFIKNFKHKVKETLDKNKTIELIFVLSTETLAFVFISHISGKFNYFRYLYHIMPILLLSFIMLVLFLKDYVNNVTIKRVVSIALVLIVGINSVHSLLHIDTVNYLYTDTYQEEKAIAENYNANCLFIDTSNNGAYSTAGATANLYRFLSYKKIYMSDNKCLDKLDEIINKEDMDNGLLVCIYTDTSWGKGYDPAEILNTILEKTEFKKYRFLNKASLCQLYFLTCEGE